MKIDSTPKEIRRNGLVQAHPVQPSAAIVNADPVFPLDQTRRRGLVADGVDMRQTIKLPFRRRSLLMVVLPCIVLFLAAVLAVVMIASIGKNDTGRAMNSNGLSTASNDSFIPTTRRGVLIQQRLEAEFGIREESKKDDGQTETNITSSFSPYSKAMDWLVNIDPLALDPSAENLLQRYLMAYFYFHTSEERPWVTCNPAIGQEAKFCSYRYVKPFDEKYDESPYNIRWLSSEHECDWAGVYCDGFKVIELSLSKCCSLVADFGGVFVASHPPRFSLMMFCCRRLQSLWDVSQANFQTAQSQHPFSAR
jgi:hypothetical protein